MAGNEVFGHDALGSPVLRVGATGSLTVTRFDVWGRVLTAPPTGPPTVAGLNQTGFTGHNNDAESALIYAQQRYLDPATGQFLSPDAATGGLLTPGSLHRHIYANSNPVRFTDPDGRCFVYSEEHPDGWEWSGTACVQGAKAAWGWVEAANDTFHGMVYGAVALTTDAGQKKFIESIATFIDSPVENTTQYLGDKQDQFHAAVDSNDPRGAARALGHVATDGLTLGNGLVFGVKLAGKAAKKAVRVGSATAVASDPPLAVVPLQKDAWVKTYTERIAAARNEPIVELGDLSTIKGDDVLVYVGHGTDPAKGGVRVAGLTGTQLGQKAAASGLTPKRVEVVACYGACDGIPQDILKQLPGDPTVSASPLKVVVPDDGTGMARALHPKTGELLPHGEGFFEFTKGTLQESVDAFFAYIDELRR